MSSASDLFKKAWDIYRMVLHYVTYALVFVWGSSAIVYQLRTRFDVALPDFGLTFVESTIVWGVLATPVYVAVMFFLTIAIMFAALFAYLGWIVLKHLPDIVTFIVEVWREERNGT